MVFGLSRVIRKVEKNVIIVELKVYFLKYGDFLKGRNFFEIFRVYERVGVVGIFYIIDLKYFRGSFEFFRKFCREMELLVLWKDFIVSKEEVERIVEVGVLVVFLIMWFLKEELFEFVDFVKEYGLDIFVEVYSEEELVIVF